MGLNRMDLFLIWSYPMGLGSDDDFLSTGYSFSSDIMATTERYDNRVAESVMEKAKSVCQEYRDVSHHSFLFII